MRRKRPRGFRSDPRLSSRLHAAVLFAFDLFEFDGADLRRKPIEERKRMLAKLLAPQPHRASRSTSITRSTARRFTRCLRTWLRRHRVEATLARRIDRAERIIGSKSESRGAGRAPRSRGGLGAVTKRFPPPWTIEEYNDACFIVKDATGRYWPASILRRSSVGDRRLSSCRAMRRGASQFPVTIMIWFDVGEIANGQSGTLWWAGQCRCGAQILDWPDRLRHCHSGTDCRDLLRGAPRRQRVVRRAACSAGR